MSARHAWVVGSTDGIGRALTQRLLDAGWRVTGISRRPAESALTSASNYTHRVSDVRAADYRHRLSELETPDVCIYCAGIGELFDPGAAERER